MAETIFYMTTTKNIDSERNSNRPSCWNSITYSARKLELRSSSLLILDYVSFDGHMTPPYMGIRIYGMEIIWFSVIFAFSMI